VAARAATGSGAGLAALRARLMSIRASHAGVAQIGWFGHSWIAQEQFLYKIRMALQAAYGNAGTGIISFADGSVTGAGTNDPAQIAAIRTTGLWSESDNGPGRVGLTLSDVNTMFTGSCKILSAAAATVEVAYLQQPGGSDLTWRIDNGPENTVHTGAASRTVGYFTISQGLSVAAPVNISICASTSSPAGLTLLQANVLSGSPGVVLHDLGRAGSALRDWLAADPLWQTQLAHYGFDSTWTMLGINDAGTLSPTDFIAGYGAFLRRITSVLPAPAPLIVTETDSGLPTIEILKQYWNLESRYAGGMKFAFYSPADSVGPYDGNDKGYYNSGNHPQAAGGIAIAIAICAFLETQFPLNVRGGARGQE
jgi:hypothetical protein